MQVPTPVTAVVAFGLALGAMLENQTGHQAAARQGIVRMAAAGDMHALHALVELDSTPLQVTPSSPRLQADELGNARYQDVVDRVVDGQDVPDNVLRQVWQNTTVGKRAVGRARIRGVLQDSARGQSIVAWLASDPRAPRRPADRLGPRAVRGRSSQVGCRSRPSPRRTGAARGGRGASGSSGHLWRRTLVADHAARSRPT